MNTISQQGREAIKAAYLLGFPARMAARLCVCNKRTAANYYERLEEELGIKNCQCGQPSRHKGWCWWRLEYSEKRIAFLQRRWKRFLSAEAKPLLWPNPDWIISKEEKKCLRLAKQKLKEVRRYLSKLPQKAS